MISGTANIYTKAIHILAKTNKNLPNFSQIQKGYICRILHPYLSKKIFFSGKEKASKFESIKIVTLFTLLLLDVRQCSSQTDKNQMSTQNFQRSNEKTVVT